MASSSPAPLAAARPPRADARRNRERILEAAKHAFTLHGAEASLDEIAQQAGVGSGTLYRHFPNRDVLIEAVYASEVEKLTSAAAHFTETLEPLEALRSWMLLFVDHVASKRLIMPAMNAVPGGSERLLEGARAPIHGAFFGLTERALESGDLRRDTDPGDLFRALVGVFHTIAMPGWESSARRIIEILIRGSRPD